MSSISARTPKSGFDSPIISELQKALSAVFRSDTQSAKKRLLFFLFFNILIWSFFALILHPLQYSIWDEFSRNPFTMTTIITAIPSWFFSLDVLFHMFFVFLGAILSYKIVARYFATVYGVKTGVYSDHFLLKIIFGFPREEPIKIDSSPILDKERWHLKEIGGPTKVIIGAESAAIFEKSGGSVQIVGPTLNLPGSFYQPDNYERLREIIDLRNQTIQFDIQARTKDGISLKIKGVNVIFSIVRDSIKSTLTRPYPFSAQALYRLVYKTPSGIFVEKVSEILKQEFINYFRHHSLTELLEYVGEPDIQKQTSLDVLEKTINFHKKREFAFPIRKNSFFIHKKYKYTLRKKSGRNHKTNNFLLKIDPRLINKNVQSPLSNHVNNSNLLIKNMMLDLMGRAHHYGIKLDWISLGSIECPSNIIQSQLQKVWQISSENQQIHTKSEFKNMKLISEKNEIDSTFADIFGLVNFDHSNEPNEQQNKIVLSKIIGFLNNCETIYDQEPLVRKNQLENAIHELENLLNSVQDQ
jgi:hypothetical protein